MIRRSHALRRRYGQAHGCAFEHAGHARGPGTSWAGTSYIDRRYYDIQPGLAMTALRTGPLGADDERMVARGQEFLAWLEPQRAPRGVQSYKGEKVASIRRLLGKALARR
jgi:hypothetical protein